MRRILATFVAALCVAAVAPMSAAAKTPKDFFGVVAQGGMNLTDAYLMYQAGVETLRFHFDWRNIQREPGKCQSTATVGVCDWTELDNAAGLFAAFKVRLFPYLLNVPSFIDPDSNTPPIRSKKDQRQWELFVASAVKRYGQGGIYWKRYFPDQFPDSRPFPVTHWEVWNEPSDGSYWQPKPDPIEYAKLLKVTGAAIHGANAKADVVFAGLFGTPTEDNDGIKAFNYYRKAFAVKRIGRAFDDVGVHPYGPTLGRLQTQMGWVLEEMKTAGFDGRDIWVTEIAWSSSEPPTILGVGPEGQANLLTKSFKLFENMQRKWNIAGLHWYSWQDLPPGFPLCEFCEKSGLVDYDRNLKPSYSAFQKLAK
ncbi:MAG: hypothetical protein ACR2OC_06085 [Solirubrobacterales bacterium]